MRPAVLIIAPLSNIRPLRLIRMSLPFALNKPAMIDGSLSKMRFRAIELEFGWTKTVDSLGAILKLFQSMITLSLVCLTAVWLGVGAVIVA
jgi:hypothetical protein